jgi:hypothetical protein
MSTQKRARSSPSVQQETHLDGIINDFKNIKNPNISDLSSFMVSFLAATNNLNVRLTDMEARTDALEERCELQENH